MSDKFSTDFTRGPVFRQLILFSLPFMGANLLQSLYNIVDMVIVGRFVGSVGLSAVSTAGNVTGILTFLAIGFSTGAQILISQLMGRNDRPQLSRAIGTVFTTMLLLGLGMTVVGVSLVEWFLQVMNTPAEAVAQARSYLYICNGGMLFTYGYNTISAVLRGMGDSRHPLLFVGIASGLNLVLDVVFVAVLDMGAAGAAWATILGQAVSFVFSLAYLFRSRDQFGFDFRPASFRVDRGLFALYVKLGLPVAFQMGAVSLSFTVISAYVNTYGVAASAIAGAGGKIASLISVVAGSMQSACASMVGQNIAQGQTDRVKTIVRDAMAFCVACGVVFCVLCLLFPKTVISLFSTDTEVLALARPYMNMSVAGYMGSFLMASTNGLILGVGAMTFNFVIAMIDCLGARIGLCILLGKVLGLGLQGFWLGGSLAGYVTVIAGLVYYFSGRWKRLRILKDL